MSTAACGVRTDARLGERPPRPGMVRAGDGRSWVMPSAGAGGRAAGPGVDPLRVSPRGVAVHRGANADPVVKKCIADDLVGRIDSGGSWTEATDDRCDRAHAVTDARGELVCSSRVPDATPRIYHRSDMVTRYTVVSRLAGGGVRCRLVDRVQRVAFCTRECDVAAREQRMRHDLDTTLPDRGLFELAEARSLIADGASGDDDRDAMDRLLSRAREAGGDSSLGARSIVAHADDTGAVAGMGLVNPKRSLNDGQGAWSFTGDGMAWRASAKTKGRR
ncbi:MAG: hypothetical protein AAF235_07255 [Planctomycetota bacterium]